MGLNINSSLLLKDANVRFQIPMHSPVLESGYLSSLAIITEMNDEIRKAKIELYQLTEMEFISEGNILKTINDKIVSIIQTILKAIVKIKDTIVKCIMSLGKNFNNKKESAKDIKDLETMIDDFYDKEIYVSMMIYSNQLKDELTDSRVPDSSVIFSNMDMDRVVDNINDIRHNTVKVNEDQIKEQLLLQKKKMVQDRIKIRKVLTGASVDEKDLNNVFMYKEQLKKFYIGEKKDTVITRTVVLKAIDNLSSYDDITSRFSAVASDVKKKYDDMYKRVEVFRKQATKELSNPSNVDGSGNPETIERIVTSIAQSVIVLSDTINAYLNDHLLAYTSKIECIMTMYNQDKAIVYSVRKVLQKKTGSIIEGNMILEKDIYDEIDENLTKYCEGCFTLHEMVAENDMQQYIQESFLLEADENKPGFKDTIDRVVSMIVEMFKKFLLSLNKLIGIDQKWFEQNEKTIKDAGFKFPAENTEIPDWIPYRFDLLEKSFDIQPFDMTNTQLMDQLKDEETFAKILYQKMGGSESDIKDEDAKNGSFAMKCKAIYSGGGETKIQVGQLQNSKDKFFDYCKAYLQGENGGIYKSISNDTKKLDQSKKNVQRALKNYKPDEPVNEPASNKAETDANKSQPNAEGENTQTSKEESFGFGVNLAEILGLSEGYSVLHELTTPDVSKSDNSAMNKSITAASGGTEDGLKEIREKANRYFTMMGNALGAKMTVSMQCYKQYKQLLRWAVKANADRSNENSDTVNKGDGESADSSIEGAAKSGDDKK